MALSRPLATSDLQLKCQGLDPELRTKMTKLSKDSEGVSDTLMKRISTHQSSILIQGQRILLAGSLSDVDLPGLSDTVNFAINEFASVHSTMLNLQTDIQALIEPCRGKRMECEDESIEKLLEICYTRKRILETERAEFIKQLEFMEEDLNSVVSDLKATACSSARETVVKTGASASLVSLGVGFMFAPFTGGVSLASALGVAAGSGLATAVHANRLDNMKDEFDEQASDHRRKASKRKDEIEKLQEQRTKCEQTCSSLKTKIDELLEAKEVLESWITKLLQADEVALNIQHVLQECRHALTKAALETGSSGVVAEHSVITGRRAKCLNDLKKSWCVLERTLQSSEQRIM